MNGGRGSDSGAARIDLAHEPPLRVAGLEIVPQRRIVRSGGVELQVEPRVLQALIALGRAGGAVVTRDELVELCWEGRIVGDDSIHQVVSKLRRLGSSLGTEIPVETVRGIGYRLKVDAMAGADRAPPRRKRRFGSAALAIVPLATAALLAPSNALREQRVTSAPVRVAILPFSDLSPGPRDSYFAEGVAEEILAMLSEQPGLEVAGRSSAALLGPKATFEDARERLGASHLVEGSVRSDAGRVRFNVRLLRTSDGMQVWAEQFDRPMGDVFALQDEVGASIASRLRGSLAAGPAPARRALRTSMEVYDLYLAANRLAWDRTHEKLLEAQRLLRRAVAIDPGYAPAWARLAINATIIDQFRPSGMYQDGPAEKARALNDAKRALALQPELADAHVALAMNLADEDPEAAAAAHERAIGLDPGNFLAWNNLGNTYNKLCRPKEALQSYRRAAAIEPLLFVPHMNLVDLLSATGGAREAEAVIARYLAVSRNPLEAQRLPARLGYFEGDLSRAVSHGLKARTLNPDNPSISTFLAFSMKAAGHGRAAASILPRTQQQTLGNYWQGNYVAAAAQARAGSNDFWAQGTRFFTVSKSLLRTGQAARLVDLFEARFHSLDAIDKEFRCTLPERTTMLILALRQVGRRAEADRLLRRAFARYDEATRAGYSHPERHVLKAELLLLGGNSDEALESLGQAAARGWMNQSEPFIGLSDPVFDPVRADARFRAVEQKIAAAAAREQREIAAAGIRL